MASVLHGLEIYAVLLIVFRVAGKRSLAQITTFDLMLLLIISEAIQQALLGPDLSITNGVLIVLTLVGIDIFLSRAKFVSDQVDRLLDDRPTLLINDGAFERDAMKRLAIDEHDIMQAARSTQGIASLAEIRFAVLERNGEISIIPKK